MSRKLDPDVFLRAAELIETGEERYACKAISVVQGLPRFDCYRNRTPAHVFFTSLFDTRDDMSSWGVSWHGIDKQPIPEPRIHALLWCYYEAGTEEGMKEQSQQLKWRAKMRAAGRCVQCGDDAFEQQSRCKRCRRKERARQKKRRLMVDNIR